MNFFTAPGGTGGSVGSTFVNFSNAMPLASARVGAVVSAAGAAGAGAGATTGRVGVDASPPKTAKMIAITAISADSPNPIIIQSRRARSRRTSSAVITRCVAPASSRPSAA